MDVFSTVNLSMLDSALHENRSEMRRLEEPFIIWSAYKGSPISAHQQAARSEADNRVQVYLPGL